MRPTTTSSQLRSFGLIVGTGFAVIGLWRAIFRGEEPRIWALIVAAALVVTALVAPALLRRFHRVWMRMGETLGWINSRIILTVVYYLVIVPIGVIRRAAGSDPLRRRFDPNIPSYKVTRSQRPASHMHHQY
jgi:O-antigen/teichoic acid export membrane protein